MVRGALFDILGSRVEGASVLDAYAGTGALGFEALSRGARSVVFIEVEAALARELRLAAARMGVAKRCRVFEGRVEAVLARRSRPGPFDLVLADPPYASGPNPDFLDLAEKVLVAGGLLVVQRDRRHRPAAPGERFEGPSTRFYGRAALDFYVKTR